MAARLLWEALDTHNVSVPAAAKRVGASRGAMLRWLYGDRVPERSFALAIQRSFDVDAALWDVKPRGKQALRLPEPKPPPASAA